MLRIGIDIGGTFTDFALWDGNESGYRSVEIFKLPSTPPRFAEGVKQGLAQLISSGRIRSDEATIIVHGTTVSTNAVIERSGPPLALLVTAGFRDILSIARLRFDRPVDLFNTRPSPLIPRRLVFEVRERLRADGSVDTPLHAEDAVAAARAALASGAEAIAICFLHAYRSPVHEQAAAAAIRTALPGIDVVLSHEVWPAAQEYERASAALLNAYARRAMADYLSELESYLGAALPRTRLLVTKSNGGVMGAAEAARMPIHTLLSGPAAGVTAAAELGRMLGKPSLLTMDMGGTSTDISLIHNGQATISRDGRVGDFPLMIPVTTIEAIGAGGGSLAWLDGSVLKAGPRSAGAVPGPACYGAGGTLPTVSDAYLLCGYLSEDAPLAGGLRLRRDRAEEAMRPIAAALGRDITRAAEAVLDVATSNMLANALPFIARLGLEPRELTLMVFGGAGAIHGPLLAREIGIGHVIIPRVSSVFCAFGGLVADLLYDVVRMVHSMTPTPDLIRETFAALEREGREWLAREAPEIAPDFEHSADVRYVGQSFDVATPIDREAAARGDLAAIAAGFHARHERLYGHADQDGETEILALRIRVRGRLPRPNAVPAPRADLPAVGATKRRVRFEGRWHETPVFGWASLPSGWNTMGPAVIEQDTATVIVPPRYSAGIGAFGDLLLEQMS
ncbi:MAG: hydantoinase/oxoprolinase family protein [Alphaproteobacteria bacterium]|nr:hydantoinase/oxoprolinase family protein [Alphaproteobacteria bacterium]